MPIMDMIVLNLYDKMVPKELNERDGPRCMVLNIGFRIISDVISNCGILNVNEDMSQYHAFLSYWQALQNDISSIYNS